MQPLPKWVLTNPLPGVFDIESGTAAEMTAKVYAAMSGLIEEYNAFADFVNSTMESFTGSEKAAREEFEYKITKVTREFICQMEKNFHTNFETTVQKMLNDAIAAGDITITEVYDPDTESLNLVIGGEV